MSQARAVLTLLARTGAASSSQLGEWIKSERNKLHNILGKLESGELIIPTAKVQLSTCGRPQTIWQLSALGARRAGIYFPSAVGREAAIKGILKTDFVLAYQDGSYPLFFADQVTTFEAQGVQWPWRGQEEPERVGAIIRSEKNLVHVGLPLVTLREAQELLEPEQLAWAQRPGYTLTLLATEEHAKFIRMQLNPMPNWDDPYCQQKKTYREWKACLRGLAPEEERYRHQITKLLQWIEMDGAQNSPERYDLIVRAFHERRFEPEIRSLWVGPLRLLQKPANKNAVSEIPAI